MRARVTRSRYGLGGQGWPPEWRFGVRGGRELSANVGKGFPFAGTASAKVLRQR